MTISQSSPIKRMSAGLAAGMVGQFLGIFYRLLLPPLFLKIWGVGVYGDWLVLTSMVAYLALTEVGGGVYVINRLNQLFIKNDLAGFRDLLNTALIFFVVISVSITVILIIGINFLPNAWLTTFKFISGSTLRIVAAILAIQITISIPQSMILGIYRAVGNMPRGIMFANSVLFLQLVFVGLGLFINLSPIEIATLQLLPVIVSAVWAVFDLKQRFPELWVDFGRIFNPLLVKGILIPSSYFFLIQLSLVLSIQGTALIVGFMFGSLEVVIFTTLRTVANIIKSLLALFTTASWPEITGLDARSDDLRLGRVFQFIQRTNTLLAVVVGLFLLNLGDQLYKIWLSDLDYVDSDFIVYMVVLIMIQVGWLGYSNLMMATNKHKCLSILFIISAMISLIFAYIGAVNNGLKGMMIGMIFAELFPAIAIPLLASKKFKFITFTKALLYFIVLSSIAIMINKPLLGIFIIPAIFYWWWLSFRALSIH